MLRTHGTMGCVFVRADLCWMHLFVCVSVCLARVCVGLVCVSCVCMCVVCVCVSCVCVSACVSNVDARLPKYIK